MRPQLWHIIVLLVVILLVFGASRLPDIARNLGKSAKVLKEEINDLRDDDKPAPPVTPAPQQGATPPGAAPQPYQPGPTPPPSSNPTDWPPGGSR